MPYGDGSGPNGMGGCGVPNGRAQGLRGGPNFGRGYGRGMGRGYGAGRGNGMGGGRGYGRNWNNYPPIMTYPQSFQPIQPVMTKEQQLNYLKLQKEQLQNEMSNLEQQIKTTEENNQ